MSAWGKAWGKAWGAAWGAVGAVIEAAAPDLGGRVRRRRKERTPVKPIDTYRTPEDIAREQRETERYLDELEKRKADQPKLPVTRPAPRQQVEAPILADVAARAASAVQAKIEEAATAEAAGRLARRQHRRKVALLLLALD